MNKLRRQETKLKTKRFEGNERKIIQRFIELIVIVSCLLVLACCFCSGAHAQTADKADFSHMQSALLPVVSGLTVPLSPLPAANYDEQLGTTFTQNFASLTYNVTAIPQADSEGYGPAYLLNGLSNDNYWYQVGISYNWPNADGGYAQGFNFNYEVFNPAGKSVYPNNSGGQKSFSGGTVNSGDLVLLDIYISNGIVSMSAKDWNTGAVAQAAYADNQTASFIGLSSPSSNGFFTGLMTEWYHATPSLETKHKLLIPVVLVFHPPGCGWMNGNQVTLIGREQWNTSNQVSSLEPNSTSIFRFPRSN